MLNHWLQSWSLKDVNPEDDNYNWEFDSKPVLEGTAIECHNTLRISDGK